MKMRVVVMAAVLLFGVATGAYAGNPLGKFCWKTGGNTTWILNVGSFSSENFEVHGYDLLSAAVCGTSNKVPLTGTAVVSGNSVTLGLWAAANEPGTCVGASFKVILNLSTLAGSGTFRNQVNVEGSITLTPTTCPAASVAEQNVIPEISSSDIPYLAK